AYSTSSFVMIENVDVQVDLRSSEMMPVASTVKIVIAIEYAFQVYEVKIDNHAPIHLRDLETYYLPKLDGGAHEAWLHYAKEKKLVRSEEHTSELQSRFDLVCRLLLEKKKIHIAMS